jgi:hypothetical protein
MINKDELIDILKKLDKIEDSTRNFFIKINHDRYIKLPLKEIKEIILKHV